MHCRVSTVEWAVKQYVPFNCPCSPYKISRGLLHRRLPCTSCLWHSSRLRWKGSWRVFCRLFGCSSERYSQLAGIASEVGVLITLPEAPRATVSFSNSSLFTHLLCYFFGTVFFYRLKSSPPRESTPTSRLEHSQIFCWPWSQPKSGGHVTVWKGLGSTGSPPIPAANSGNNPSVSDHCWMAPPYRLPVEQGSGMHRGRRTSGKEAFQSLGLLNIAFFRASLYQLPVDPWQNPWLYFKCYKANLMHVSPNVLFKLSFEIF